MNFFSVVSGRIYEALDDELDTIDRFSVPLSHLPKKSCPKCFGRFHIGKNIKNNQYEICPKCVKKCLDVEFFKKTMRKQMDAEISA